MKKLVLLAAMLTASAPADAQVKYRGRLIPPPPKPEVRRSFDKPADACCKSVLETPGSSIPYVYPRFVDPAYGD